MLPIPGTFSLEHLKESLAALENELTDAELRALLPRVLVEVRRISRPSATA